MPTPSTASPQRSRTRRFRRTLGALVILGAVVVLTTGCLPVLLDPPTSGRTYGQGPLDSVREAADRTASSGQYASCGLSATDLAAMMLVPTYFEAGGPVPAPMTMSRWDNVSVSPSNANLFAFGQTSVSSPYLNAYFSPGAGLWAFDSAGGWDMTAADAIDTNTAANQAADTIAYRWCNAPPSRLVTPQARRLYAWGPWFGCTNGNSTGCEDLFNSLVSGDKLNIAFDPSVSRTGGMQARTCTVRGITDGITCFYINPALAEGSRGWQGGTYDGRTNYVTPLPKPFYDFRANGTEYRVWLKEDTGYAIDITASKPVTANARTSLTWSATTGLCDPVNRHGACGNVSPSGSFDSLVQVTPGQIRVAGWALDGDTTDAIPVHVYVGAQGTAITADTYRPDVGQAFPGMGDNHGFVAVIPAAVGPQQVCAYAIDIGGGAGNVLLGCQTITVTGVPQGSLDVVATRPGAISVGGWMTLPGDGAAPAIISVDGAVVAQFARTVARPDVQAIIPSAEPISGYNGDVVVSGGPHRVCLTAGAAVDGALGCRMVTVPTGSPFGSFDVAGPVPGAIQAAGWAIDPDTSDPIPVHVYIDSQGTPLVADGSRPDVAAAFPGYGAAHGFWTSLAASPGAHQVCAYGINVGGGGNVLLGCRTVTVPTGPPFGSLDLFTRTAGGVFVGGWAIDPDTASAIPVHVYVGAVGTPVTADGSRPDVAAAFPGYGEAHGFGATVAAPATPVQVCVYAIEVAGTGGNRLLACRTV